VDVQPYLVQWALSLISEDDHCTSLLVCSYPINSLVLSSSESRSGLVIVLPSQYLTMALGISPFNPVYITLQGLEINEKQTY